MTHRVHFPSIRLRALAAAPGGLSRDAAIAAAQAELETIRPEADQIITGHLAAIETIAATLQGRHGHAPGRLAELLAHGDQIVALAGTFGHDGLDAAARCFCDLVTGLLRTQSADTASVMVHVRTLRLLAPGAARLEEDQRHKVLSELARILDHHGFARAKTAP